MKFLTLISALLLALCLAGCSYAALYKILNNSGDSLEIEAIKWADGEGIKREMRRLSKRRWMEYGDVSGEGKLVLKKDACFYRYSIPALVMGSTDPFPLEHAPELTVRLQIEPNMSLHFVPDSVRKAVNVLDYADIQPPNFPATPVVECSSQ